MRIQGRKEQQKRRADAEYKAVRIQRRMNSTCGVHMQKRSEETRKKEQQKRREDAREKKTNRRVRMQRKEQ